MKRWIILFLATVALGLLARMDHTGTDVAQLEPVEVVYVDVDEGIYIVSTDTGQQGRGITLAGAIDGLKQGASGKVFLETAEHLLVSPAARESLPRLLQLLRPDCSLALAQSEPNMVTVARFLDTHRPGLTLNDYRALRRELPVLYTWEGGMNLENP